MTMLSVTLFGPGELALDGAILRVHSAKTLALLAFLAIESDRPHTRARLAALVWSEAPEPAARQSLRQALYSLRRVGAGRLGTLAGLAAEQVRLAPHPDLRIDVVRFLACVQGTDVDAWSEAAALYRAPLLAGQSFDGCDELEAWLATAREHLQSLASQNLSRLLVGCIARGEDDRALQHAEALRAIDPMNEPASRGLMRLFAARSEPQRVDAEWRRLSTALQRDLGVAPNALTRATYLGLSGRAARDARVHDDTAAAAGPVAAADAVVRAARAAERVHAFGHALDLYERVLRMLRIADPAEPERLCETLVAKEAVLDRLGRRAEQVATLEEAVGIARGLGDPSRLAVVLLRRAGAGAYLGPSEARPSLDAACEALRLHRELCDRPGEAEALRELGFVHWRLQQPGEALERSRQAHALHRSLGDVAGEASALHNLAEIHRGLGSVARALELYDEALRLHWAARSPGGEILTRFGVAGALHQSGQPGRASDEYRSALAMSERHGERTMQARALQALARLARERGALDEALDAMQRAVAIDRAISYAHALGHDLVALSDIHLLRHERAEARATLQEALVWFEYTDNADAAASARLRLDAPEGGPAPMTWTSDRSVRSHLHLPEGKVYCAFESPVAAGSQPAR
jgi:DNA-binding SARP family transcriptional activator